MNTFYFLSIGFMFTLISSSLFFNKYANSLVRHGYTDKWLSKNYFLYFYLFATLLFLVKSNVYNIYLVHLIRRCVESVIFRYSNRNRMSVIQFATSFVYYYFLVMNLVDKKINTKSFMYANLLQFIMHYCINKKFYFVYGHYYCEVLIYLIIFVNVRNLFSGLNLIWVITYCYISISNRKSMSKGSK